MLKKKNNKLLIEFQCSTQDLFIYHLLLGKRNRQLVMVDCRPIGNEYFRRRRRHNT